MKKIKLSYNNSIRGTYFLPKHNSASEVCVSVNVMSHNKKYHSGIRGIYITNTSTTIVFANEKNRSTTITVPRLLLPFP